MALIKCIECGNKISDKAKICPHCGYSLNKKAIKKGRKLQNRENMWHNIKAASDTVQKATENNHTNTSSASDYQGQSHKNIPPLFGWIVSVFFILLGILFLLDSTTSAGLMMLSGLIINPMIRTKARIPLGIAVYYLPCFCVQELLCSPQKIPLLMILLLLRLHKRNLAQNLPIQRFWKMRNVVRAS